MSCELPQKPLVVAIDGEIGAGKTTLLELLNAELSKRGYRVAIVREPVDKWEQVGILKEYYMAKSDTDKRNLSYIFQTYTYVTRICESRKVVRDNPDATIILLERSVFTDRYVFVERLRNVLGANYMKMYEEWYDQLSPLIPICPSKFIYLKPSLDRCMERVARRARTGELCGVSEKYQRDLREVHEAFLQGLHADVFPDMPKRPFDMSDVTVIDGDLADNDFSKPGADAGNVVNVVVKILADN